VLSDAENGGKLLIAFRTFIFVAGHPLSLLSLLEWDFPNYLIITDTKTDRYQYRKKEFWQ
jgi:hypothetical protein